MNWPPSLAPAVLARSFRTANGELGVRPGDATAFLDACAADGVELLGWELWLCDHAESGQGPRPAPGRWSGLIPLRGRDRRAVVVGAGDLAATRAQLADFDLDAVDARWRDHVRINLTLDGD